MKWFKNKEDNKLGLYIDVTDKNTTAQICQANENKNECSGVAKIRELQQELKSIEQVEIDALIDFIEPKDPIGIDYTRNTIYIAIDHIQRKLSGNRDLANLFMETFQRFMDRENKIVELEKQIKEEKEKLGIE